jgi:single-strand DNA-binding protein
MASVNKVVLIGNLGKDPELRHLPSGQAMAKFPLATTDSWMDGERGRQERTEWHNVVVWGRQAETCGQYLAKGRQVYIEGAIRSRTYEDKEGNKRYMTEVVAQRVQFLGGGGAGKGTQGTVGGGGFDDFDAEPPGAGGDDDIPF